MTEIRTWTGGSSPCQRWAYRLSLVEGEYRLEVKGLDEPDSLYRVVVRSHPAARRIASWEILEYEEMQAALAELAERQKRRSA